jgi:hypothetical protein
MSRSTKCTDHKTIERWAEEHDISPARVSSTSDNGEGGILRLMKPHLKHSNSDGLEKISWQEWFAIFDEHQLALVIDPESNFNKVVSR